MNSVMGKPARFAGNAPTPDATMPPPNGERPATLRDAILETAKHQEQAGGVLGEIEATLFGPGPQSGENCPKDSPADLSAALEENRQTAAGLVRRLDRVRQRLG